jgi:lipopolysaccharide heptosyltransferase II
MNITQYRNILIIKPSALGDIAHTLPVLSSLRASYPQARLSWLVRREFAPLLQCAEGLNDILLFDRKNLSVWYRSLGGFAAFRDLCKQLKAGQFDLVLDLQGLFRSALFAWMTGCADRVGMKEAREFANLFHTRVVDRPAGSVHLLDYYHAVLKEIGAPVRLTECTLSAPPAAKGSIRKKLQQNGLRSKQFLVLVPSSAHASKCWPPQRFAAIAENFHKQRGWDTVAAGTAGDKPIIQTIRQHSKIPVLDFAGLTTIPELVALFEQAAAVISNDTGPGHIALATSTPTVLIFGLTNPLRLGPYHRPQCIAAIEPNKRGIAVKSSNPAWRIEHVPIEMVRDKILEQLTSQKPV